jgi:hypothetical protein
VPLFIYYLGPTDWFEGFTRLDEFIEHCVQGLVGKNDGRVEAQILRWVEYCLDQIHIHARWRGHALWEGDTDEVWVSAVPSGEPSPYLLLTIKQQNNGSTFVASEFRLPGADDDLTFIQHDYVRLRIRTSWDQDFEPYGFNRTTDPRVLALTERFRKERVQHARR